MPPAASLMPSTKESRFNKIKPVIKADMRKNIAINVKKIIPDSLKVAASCLEISEPKNAPIDPPAAITPKTFVAPSPLNKLMITTQKIETTKNTHYTKHKNST